jgi:hypothetical protein
MKRDYQTEKADKMKATNKVMLAVIAFVVIFIVTIFRLAVRDL